MTEQLHAVGVDGCPAGWVVAIAYSGPGGAVSHTKLRLYANADGGLGRLVNECEAWRSHGNEVVLAVDVPMGLPGRGGLRACDTHARALLGRRWQCVFPAPDRELLGLSFEDARDIVLARRATDPGAAHPIMTKQTMAIAPKIAEADVLLAAEPARQRWLVEVHPELSFLALARDQHHPAALTGLPRKKRSAGRAVRRELISAVFEDARGRIDAATWTRSFVGHDDMLDAYAGLWSAMRYRAAGRNAASDRLTVIGSGPQDQQGLLAQMIV